MLTELYIRDFAIIDELRLQLAPGFNVLTGETGAGKSIILDAVGLLLGERADATMVRADSDGAYVEGLFRLEPRARAALLPLLEAEALDEEIGDELIVAREVRGNGRSLARVNGRAVGVRLLQEVGEYLIDIHGQGTHLSLLRPKAHLPLLDAFAGLEAEVAAFGREVAALRKLQAELAELRQDERQLAKRIDMLNFQVQEIDAAALTPGEDGDLLTERKRLASAEQLMQQSALATALLLGVDDGTPAALDMLGDVERALTLLVRYDDSQAPLLETFQGLYYQLNELAAEIGDYQESLEFDQGRLNAVEERIELINKLKRKYGDTIEEVLAHRDARAAELANIERSGERAEALDAAIEGHLRRLGQRAGELAVQRRVAATRLAQMVERELGDLRMTARFAVDFEQRPDPAGLYVDAARLAFDTSGVDRAEFLLSTNPGEPLKPMARIASGGETARIMLALKTALSRVDVTPTLIFDEIDQGIGGRVSETVGRKLWELTNGGAHQVIVVTHLPQLAGYGDRHFHVRKQVERGRTYTRVHDLDHAERVAELAAMLGTDETHARESAAAYLAATAQVKALPG